MVLGTRFACVMRMLQARVSFEEDLACAPRSGASHEPPLRRSSPRTRPANDRIRVLVVEPAPVLRHIITHALSVQGYAVATAPGRNDLAEVLASFDPHIVVTELHLSDGSGEDVCRDVRRRPHKLVPVVLMSSAPEGELERRGQAAAADRCFRKTRGLSSLLELIDDLTAEILF